MAKQLKYTIEMFKERGYDNFSKGQHLCLLMKMRLLTGLILWKHLNCNAFLIIIFYKLWLEGGKVKKYSSGNSVKFNYSICNGFLCLDIIPTNLDTT